MFKHPLLSKLLGIGLVAALLSLLLARIGFLVDERSARQDEAVRSVQRASAGEQTLVGPLLQRQCTEEWTARDDNGKTHTERRTYAVVAPPSVLEVSGDLVTEARYRGLFKVNGYVTRLALDVQWREGAGALAAQAEHPGGRLSCQAPTVMLALGDVRGVRAAKVQAVAASGSGSTELVVRPGTGHEIYTQGWHVVAPTSAAGSSGPLHLNVTLELAGTARLALVPVAEDTRWRLQANWPHPSFGGRFLPVEREITPQGFSARWSVSALASSASTEVRKAQALCASPSASRYAPSGEEGDAPAPTDNCLDTLTVTFIDPVNPYMLSDRAIKYGLLFIGLTFVAVALAEVLGRERIRRVHPIQYALVGLALTLFFLLLLSLSEHLSFALAYAVASAACVLLLGLYTGHMLGTRRAGLGFGAGMAGLYGLVYLLLNSEQMALVIGSVGLFLVLGVVMWVTRGVDWYTLFSPSSVASRGRPHVSGHAEEQLPRREPLV